MDTNCVNLITLSKFDKTAALDIVLKLNWYCHIYLVLLVKAYGQFNQLFIAFID